MKGGPNMKKVHIHFTPFRLMITISLAEVFMTMCSLNSFLFYSSSPVQKTRSIPTWLVDLWTSSRFETDIVIEIRLVRKMDVEYSVNTYHSFFIQKLGPLLWSKRTSLLYEFERLWIKGSDISFFHNLILLLH